MSCKVAVVILNWNGRSLLERFVPTVLEYSKSPDVRIYVADNASTDDSVAYLQENFPAVEIIQNPENGGYSKGYNQSLAQISAEYYVLLNSDIEVTPNWIDPVIDLMDSDEMISACQPKIKDLNRKDYFEYAGAAGGFIDLFGYPFCRGRIFSTLEKDTGQYDEVTEIFWASGACLFVRANAFREVRGLDEHLFAHMEEIDMCWRMKNLGYRIMYCPDAQVYHLGGGTLESGSPRKTFYNFRNNLFMVFQNLPRERLVWVILVRMVLDGIAALKFLIGGQAKHFFPVVRAHIDFYKNLRKLTQRRLRNEIRYQRIKFYNAYRGSIASAYFLFGIRKFSRIKKSRFYR